MTTDVSQARFLAVAVISSAALVACVPSDKVAVTGHVSLEYERTTDSDVYVKLTNGSARAISLQGSFDIWKRGIEITPGIAGIVRTAGATSEEEGPGFSDRPTLSAFHPVSECAS